MSLEAAVRARGHTLQAANTAASHTREQLSSFRHSDASKPVTTELVEDLEWAALVRCRERLEAIEAQLCVPVLLCPASCACQKDSVQICAQADQ